MAHINRDLHGMAPDKSPVALILLDVINVLDFPEADDLLRYAKPMADKLAVLRQRAEEANVPVVYVNDNYNKWRSEYQALVNHCINDNTRSKDNTEQLKPTENDYFVLKPK